MSGFESIGCIDPYETSYGKLLPTKDIKFMLASLIKDMRDDLSLSYGIDFGNCTAVIITGKSRAESNIPPFELPLLFTGANGNKYIAIDIREYVNSKVNEDLEGYNDLLSCVPRHENLKILCRIAMVMSKMLDGNYGVLPKDEIMAIYVCIMTSVITGVVRLSAADEVALRIMLAAYAYFLMCKDDPHDVDNSLLVRTIQNKLKLSSSKEMVTTIQEIVFVVIMHMNKGDIRKTRTIEGLIAIANEVFEEDVAKFFNQGVIVNQLKSLWYGPGKQVASITMVESIPVLVGVCEGALGIPTFKSSRLTQLLNKYGRIIDSKDFVKKCELNFKYL